MLPCPIHVKGVRSTVQVLKTIMVCVSHSSSHHINLTCQNFPHIYCLVSSSFVIVWCTFWSGADEMDDAVEEMHAVVEEQRQEIDYLLNVLENMTTQRRGDTDG